MMLAVVVMRMTVAVFLGLACDRSMSVGQCAAAVIRQVEFVLKPLDNRLETYLVP